jgi:heat shock protein HslJ
MAANLLEHRAWRLAGWSISSLNPNDFSITSTFSDGRVSGKSAVNSYSGPVTVSASSSSIDVGPLMSTRMAGPPDAMRAENAFHTLLSSVTSWHVSGKKLTLKDGSGNEVLLFREGGA